MSYGYFYGSQSEAYSFFRIPRELIKNERFKKVSTEAKLLYGLMLDRMGVSAKNEWFDELGRVYIYYTVEQIMDDLGCSHVTAGKLLAELDTANGVGLIERVKHGQGKPTTIYVKQFTAVVPVPELEGSAPPRPKESLGQDIKKVDVYTERNFTSKPKEDLVPDLKNVDANYNNKNYNKPSYNNLSINQETMEKLKEQVKDQIDYEMLCSYYPYDDPESILELICDVLSSTASSIKIGNEHMPTSKVQSRFRRLAFDHVAYVLDAFKECTSKIHNIKAYLLTALYNAPLTIGPYYSAAVRHDDAQKLFSP